MSSKCIKLCQVWNVCVFFTKTSNDSVWSLSCSGYLPLLHTLINCVCVSYCLCKAWLMCVQQKDILWISEWQFCFYSIPNTKILLKIMWQMCSYSNWQEHNSTYGAFPIDCLYITMFTYDTQRGMCCSSWIVKMILCLNLLLLQYTERCQETLTHTVCPLLYITHHDFIPPAVGKVGLQN